MANPLPFLVAGLVIGSVYGLAALGLVFAYRVSNTINFAHGAIAMFAAFSYWQLHADWGLHAVPSGMLAIVLLPVALGLLTERFVFRRLSDSTVFARTAASIGVLLVLYGLAQWWWSLKDVNVPSIFPTSLISLPGVVVSTQQIGIVLTVVAITALMLFFLRFTRAGLEMRAVVDRRALAEVRGVDSIGVSRQAWVVSSLMAGVSGLLLAPLFGSDPLLLTLVVVYSLVAAAIGGMSSLPLTLAGGLLLGLADSLAIGYAPQGAAASQLRGMLPFAALFLVLVVKSRRFAAKSALGSAGAAAVLSDLGAVTERRHEPTIRGAAVATGGLMLLGLMAGDYWALIAATGVAYGVLFLSFTVFTATTGLVSLAQGAFAGCGAFTAAMLAAGGVPWPIAVLVGAAAAAAAGAVVALPTVRLRGVYLVLATIAFAQFVEATLFNSEGFTGSSFGRLFPRPAGFTGPMAYLLLSLAFFFALGWLASWLRRSRIGKALQADLGSAKGALSIGIRPEWGRLVAFVASAAVAGVGGSLLASLSGQVTPLTWSLLNAFVWLTLTAVGGIGSIWGALAAGLLLSLTPEVIRAVPTLEQIYVALFGLAGLIFLRRPGGMVRLARGMRRATVALSGAGRGRAAAPGLPPLAPVPRRGMRVWARGLGVPGLAAPAEADGARAGSARAATLSEALEIAPKIALPALRRNGVPAPAVTVGRPASGARDTRPSGSGGRSGRRAPARARSVPARGAGRGGRAPGSGERPAAR